jgi:hypothetical protein
MIDDVTIIAGYQTHRSFTTKQVIEIDGHQEVSRYSRYNLEESRQPGRSGLEGAGRDKKRKK